MAFHKITLIIKISLLFHIFTRAEKHLIWLKPLFYRWSKVEVAQKSPENVDN